MPTSGNSFCACDAVRCCLCRELSRFWNKVWLAQCYELVGKLQGNSNDKCGLW